MAKKEINELECPECGYVAGAPVTARIHLNTHTVEEQPVEAPKKAAKKK